MPDYAQSAGKSREMLRQLAGKQPGDPDRAARAIARIVDADRPPLRLALGRMAIDHIRAGLHAELEELDAWADLGASADFPSDGAAAPSHKTAHEDLVRRAYAAFNARDIEAAVALMAPDVDWPDAAAGGVLHGRDQVREHWSEQFRLVVPRIEIAEVTETSTGHVEAHVRQVVQDPNGRQLSDDPWVHIFTIDHDRIARMEVKPETRS
jgi:hypothetical protein